MAIKPDITRFLRPALPKAVVCAAIVCTFVMVKYRSPAPRHSQPRASAALRHMILPLPPIAASLLPPPALPMAPIEEKKVAVEKHRVAAAQKQFIKKPRRSIHRTAVVKAAPKPILTKKAPAQAEPAFVENDLDTTTDEQDEAVDVVSPLQQIADAGFTESSLENGVDPLISPAPIDFRLRLNSQMPLEQRITEFVGVYQRADYGRIKDHLGKLRETAKALDEFLEAPVARKPVAAVQPTATHASASPQLVPASKASRFLDAAKELAKLAEPAPSENKVKQDEPSKISLASPASAPVKSKLVATLDSGAPASDAAPVLSAAPQTVKPASVPVTSQPEISRVEPVNSQLAAAAKTDVDTLEENVSDSREVSRDGSRDENPDEASGREVDVKALPLSTAEAIADSYEAGQPSLSLPTPAVGFPSGPAKPPYLANHTTVGPTTPANPAAPPVTPPTPEPPPAPKPDPVLVAANRAMKPPHLQRTGPPPSRELTIGTSSTALIAAGVNENLLEEGGALLGTVEPDSAMQRWLESNHGHIELYLHPVKSRDPQDTIFIDYEYPNEDFNVDLRKLRGQYFLVAGIYTTKATTPAAQIYYPSAITAASYKDHIRFAITRDALDKALARMVGTRTSSQVFTTTLFEGAGGNPRLAKPIPNGALRVIGFPEWGAFSSDGDGNIRIPKVPGRSELLIEASAPGYYPTYRTIPTFGTDEYVPIYLISKDKVEVVTRYFPRIALRKRVEGS